LECSKIPNLGTLELPMCLHSGAPTRRSLRALSAYPPIA
jgi:hypothetical protein